MVKLTAEEKRWQAEDDARALRRAEEIKLDKSRFNSAQGIIKKELKALQSIAKTSKKKASNKKTSKKKTQNKKKTNTRKKTRNKK